MSEIETLTVDELIALLTKFPHDTKVYMSSAEDGNGYYNYSTIDASFDDMRADKVIILSPAQEGLFIDEICPEWWRGASIL